MAKQIIVTQNNYGILLETQFIDDAKNPIDLTGYSVTVEFEYLEKCFDVLDATIINAEEGRVGVILEQKHTAEIGLYKTQWSVIDDDENVTAQEDIYYFVKKEVAMEEEKEELGINIDAGGIIEKFKDLDETLLRYSEKLTEIENYVDTQTEFNLINTYPVSFFGVKADGITDDTEALRKALTFRSDITLVFPENETIIVTEPISTYVNNLKILGNNCMVKVKDNCNMLEKISNREFNNTSSTVGLFEFFGDNIEVKNLGLDVNCINNGYIDANGGVWYQFSTNHGDSSLPTGMNNSGMVCLFADGDNILIDGCKLLNGSWGGIMTNSKRKPTHARNIEVKNCYFSGCLQDATHITYGKDVKIHNNVYENNYFHCIHSYNSNINVSIYDNFINFTKDYVKLKITPNNNAPEIQAPINLAHSNYIQCESINLVCDNNTIVNNSETAVGKWGIYVQFMSYARDFRISNNYFKNFNRAILTDIYHFGENYICGNRMVDCTYPITFRLSVTNYCDTGLPTFTTEIPNCKFIVRDNTFYRCDTGVTSQIADGGSTLHKERTSGVTLALNNNCALDKTIREPVFNTNEYTKLTIELGYRKKDLTFISGTDWKLTDNIENTNYFIEDRKTNVVHVFFDIEKGTKQEMFFIPGTSVNNIPCMILKDGVWSASVLSVKDNSMVRCPYAKRDGTERIVGTFSYRLH